MAEAQPGHWRFEPTAARDAPAPDRVEWRFTLQPYAGGEVRSFVPADMDDETFGVHRPIAIEARLYLNGRYRRLVKGTEIIQGGPHDPISLRQSRDLRKTSSALRALTVP